MPRQKKNEVCPCLPFFNWARLGWEQDAIHGAVRVVGVVGSSVSILIRLGQSGLGLTWYWTFVLLIRTICFLIITECIVDNRVYFAEVVVVEVSLLSLFLQICKGYSFTVPLNVRSENIFAVWIFYGFEFRIWYNTKYFQNGPFFRRVVLKGVQKTLGLIFLFAFTTDPRTIWHLGQFDT